MKIIVPSLSRIFPFFAALAVIFIAGTIFYDLFLLKALALIFSATGGVMSILIYLRPSDLVDREHIKLLQQEIDNTYYEFKNELNELKKKIKEEVKFFQNELSSFEDKYIALWVAYQKDKGETFEAVVKTLAKTERNIVLDKGQTTIDLEREKMGNEALLKTLESMLDIIKKIKIGKGYRLDFHHVSH